MVKQRIMDGHIQMLYSDVSENRLCTIYRTFKFDAEFEPHLTLLKIKERILITKLRCGSHNLPVANERYLPIDEVNSCPFCPQEVGDEFHFTLVCPKFNGIRVKYINRNYWERPNILKFSNLLSSKCKTTLIRLSKFIGEVFTYFPS